MFWYLLVCNFCERKNLIYRRWLSVSWYMHQFTVVFLEQQSQNFLENSQKTLIFLIKNPTQMFSREFCSTFLNSKKSNKKTKQKNPKLINFLLRQLTSISSATPASFSTCLIYLLICFFKIFSPFSFSFKSSALQWHSSFKYFLVVGNVFMPAWNSLTIL